jgi:hypothetical protein
MPTFVPTNQAVLDFHTPTCNYRLPLDLARQILWPPAAPCLPSQAVIHSSDEEARITAYPHPQSNLIPRSTLKGEKSEVFPCTRQEEMWGSVRRATLIRNVAPSGQ